MHLRRGEFERIRSVLLEVEPDEPLTAREILDLLEEHGETFDSPHKIATILGRYAGSEVEVIPDRPYRYRIRHN